MARNNDYAYLYPYSREEAQRHDELDLWKNSYLENCACKYAIEHAIKNGFDGMYLNADCASSVLESFGFKRTGYILAVTLQRKDYDGRFSPRNKDWAKETFIAESNERALISYTVDSHPAVLNGFVDQFRRELEAKQLFGPKDCDTIWQELEGKVLVMKPSTLKESCWTPQNQLWLATGGFGCGPKASGRAVYATCLGDGEKTRWNREDFIGVIRDEQLPDWAREQLEKLRNGEELSPENTTPCQEMTL